MTLLKQFEITRGALIKSFKEMDETTANVQPNGFNNTIRWQLGHVLLSGESFLFGFPKRSTNLPNSYLEWFGRGSNPSSWTQDVPSVSVLVKQLEEQSTRIRELTPTFFDQSLPYQFPFGNIETFGELFGFMLFHEANHLGQMLAMKRIIEN